MDRVAGDKYHKREFWACENLKYVEPHFRLEKAAYLLNGLAHNKKIDVLDVGCGPATLQSLLASNITYYGIDIAIHNASPNLLEEDFIENPINWNGRTFDIVLAQGVFEYIGKFQNQKLAEIARVLKPRGRFVVSYVNFDHVRRVIYHRYNNVQPMDDFRKALEQHFSIEQIVPTSHHWRHREPTRPIMKNLQMHLRWRIPFISSRLAIEYFFICSRYRNGEQKGRGMALVEN